MKPWPEPLARWLAAHIVDETVVVGLTGAQGTGKSTLATRLQQMLQNEFRIRTAVVSLDDLYLTAEERQAKAESVHPLLATRGVPGTHDVDLGLRVLRGLRRVRKGARVVLPSFDKATDDRRPKTEWGVWTGPCDLVIFEGWCVGARAQLPRELTEPVNALERDEDPVGKWREYVNHKLGGPYQELFRELDLLVMLRPPSLDRVYRWREQQEAELRDRAGTARHVMSPPEVRRFVMHFERLTRFMLDEMPSRADAVVDLGDDHEPRDLQFADDR